MLERENKILCFTPTPDKQGTRIAIWRYELIRKAIRKVVPRSKEGIEFRQLFDLVRKQLTNDERTKLGSVSWYTTTVKLHMEVIGELERVVDSKPQRLRLRSSRKQVEKRIAKKKEKKVRLSKSP